MYSSDRSYLDENRDLFEVKREMEEGGYTEYQYDYNGKNLTQLIDECVRSVVGRELFLLAHDADTFRTRKRCQIKRTEEGNIY